MNIILKPDSYKHSHYLQLPPKTTYTMEYIESRGGADHLVLFGPQAALKKYFKTPGKEQIEEAQELIHNHIPGLPFNREGWDRIAKLGHLPLRIRALPEGTVAKSDVPLMTIESTDEQSAWLPAFIADTPLLRSVWYGSTVATYSWKCRQVIKKYLEETGDPALLDYKLHDFGGRGTSSGESAAIGGTAHLVNFNGTDTVEALPFAKKYYGEKMAGHSVPAAEHATITIWGKDNEGKAFENMVARFGHAGGIYSVVSDSYDIFNAVDNIVGGTLHDQLMNSGSVFVVRPDSGNPALVVLEVIKRLYAKFGGMTNTKGYIVLHPCVRVLQGDGINLEMIDRILGVLKVNGFSADNITFGMGGALLQAHTRDDYRFAAKMCVAIVDGEIRIVYKDPITDSGKRSKSGSVDTVLTPDGFKFVDRLETNPAKSDYCDYPSAMQTVWENGELWVDDKFSTIRHRARA